MRLSLLVNRVCSPGDFVVHLQLLLPHVKLLASSFLKYSFFVFCSWSFQHICVYQAVVFL